jgi:AbiV family abortive infection protein
VAPIRVPIPSLSDSQARLFDVLERNARRLLNDAKVIFNAGSHGSAISLAVLSMEESSKFWMLAFYYNLEDRQLAQAIIEELRSHSFKQLHAAFMISGFAFRQTVRSLVEESGSLITVDRFIFTHKAIRTNPGQYPELVELSKQFEAELERRADQWFREADLMNLFDQVRDKEIDVAKQNGFYVDFDPDDQTVGNDPHMKTAEEAEYYIFLAETLCRCFLQEKDKAGE